MASSLTTADIPLLRATLTIQDALNTLPGGLGLHGAARLAGGRAGNEEELWELLPALSAVEDTAAIRAIHACYIDRRWTTLAIAYFGDFGAAVTASLRDLQCGRRHTGVSIEAEKILRTAAEGFYTLDGVSEAARAVLSLLHAQEEPRTARGTFVEYVSLRRLLVLAEEATAEESWMLLIREVLAL